MRHLCASWKATTEKNVPRNPQHTRYGLHAPYILHVVLSCNVLSDLQKRYNLPSEVSRENCPVNQAHWWTKLLSSPKNSWFSKKNCPFCSQKNRFLQWIMALVQAKKLLFYDENGPKKKTKQFRIWIPLDDWYQFWTPWPSPWSVIFIFFRLHKYDDIHIFMLVFIGYSL